MMELFNLDDFMAWLKDFYNGLLAGSKPYGSFLWKNQPVPNLLYINDVVWMKWLADDLDPDDRRRSGLIDSINDHQYPEGGFYHNPVFERHTWQHATWRAMVSLNMLGGSTRYPLSFLDALRGEATCREWVGSHESLRNDIAHHRYALGAFAMRSGASEAWCEAFFSGIRALQHEGSGFWAVSAPEKWSGAYMESGSAALPAGNRNMESLSPTFLFSVIHLAFGRAIPRMERILDTAMAFQRENGNFTGGDDLGFHDMDALFLLNAISKMLPARRKEALQAMRRSALALRRYWDEGRDRVFLSNPHQTLALCGMLSVLKDALPDEIGGRSACRFPYGASEFIRLPG